MRHHLPKQAIDCPNCRTTHICGIQEDEDGPYVEIETQPCHADGCTTRLCTSCPQAECSECTLTHCEAHSIVTATGPICPVCFAQLVEEGRTARELMAGEECGAGMPEGLRQPEDDQVIPQPDVTYSAMIMRFLYVLRAHKDEVQLIHWHGVTFPWDKFTRVNPQAKEWAAAFLQENHYELSERQCSAAVVMLCEELRQQVGHDGRDDLDDRDAHQIGSERCPPRE